MNMTTDNTFRIVRGGVDRGNSIPRLLRTGVRLRAQKLPVTIGTIRAKFLLRKLRHQLSVIICNSAMRRGINEMHNLVPVIKMNLHMKRSMEVLSDDPLETPGLAITITDLVPI